MAIALAACSRPPEPSLRRIAILTFDNQTGDPSLGWIDAATASIVDAQLTGLDRVMPVREAALSDAYASRANVFVHGVFTGRAGSLKFTAQVEDAQTHRTIQAIHSSGSIVASAAQIARAIDPAARPFTSSNDDAVAAWGHADFEKAVAIDPDFGQAWMSWVQRLEASKEPAQAAETAERALATRSLRGNIERAQLDLQLASARNDEGARTAALAQLSKLLPADTGILRARADIEMAARHFAVSADLNREILKRDPQDALAMNALGYAESCAGNLEAAVRAFTEYEHQPGQEPNALDSIGEAYFMNGKFSDAEKYFLQAHDRQPALIGGGDLLKAAYAHWLSGDLPGADALDQRYLQFRAGMRDPLLAWRQATWLYSTGRAQQALVKLNSAPPNEAELRGKQLAVWRSLVGGQNDVAGLKAIYDKTPPTGDGPVRTLYAAALFAAGQKDQARELCSRWPLPGTGDSLTESPMFPRFLELRRQLGLK